MWAYVCWNIAPGPVITAEDVDLATPLVISRLDESFFRVRFDRLTPRERQYLRAMAEIGPGPLRSGGIADILGVQGNMLGPCHSGLISKGMIFSPSYGDTAFTVPLFDQYMKRVMPFNQVGVNKPTPCVLDIKTLARSRGENRAAKTRARLNPKLIPAYLG